MGSVNKVILVGNLGADPEMKQTQNGKSVATLSIATNERWKGADGQTQERTEWHRVVCWEKLAELCGKYLVKGRSVYLEGRLQTRKWQDDKGNDRYTTEIVARDVVFIGGKMDNDNSGERQPPQAQPSEDAPF